MASILRASVQLIERVARAMCSKSSQRLGSARDLRIAVCWIRVSVTPLPARAPVVLSRETAISNRLLDAMTAQRDSSAVGAHCRQSKCKEYLQAVGVFVEEWLYQ